MMVESRASTLAPSSLPALAAVMRRHDCTARMELIQTLFKHDPLVPMYDVEDGAIQDETMSALHALEDISERMRRLHMAYGEWSEFDASAYFDLTHAQTNRLVHVSERVSTVHVTFYADLLLPSFHKAENCWYDEYCPAYSHMMEHLNSGDDPAQAVRAFTKKAQPAMTKRWSRLQNVVDETRTALIRHSDYLVAYLSRDECNRWQHEWRSEPALGIHETLLPDLGSLNTLTMSTEFPLPTGRQPGRLRRLRANRARRRPSQFMRRPPFDS